MFYGNPFFLQLHNLHRDDLSKDERFRITLQSIKRNDRYVTKLIETGHDDYIQNMTGEEWEQLGRNIANNTHLTEVSLYNDALNDHKMQLFFLRLTKSRSIENLFLRNNQLSVVGMRSMVPFLQNASNLTELNLNYNSIQTEGFNTLFWALRDSPIETLYCSDCGIESIEIDSGHIPRHLVYVDLEGNRINADGCRGLAKLLGSNATLKSLYLEKNQIDDEGVEILVNALQSNTSLECLSLVNDDISWLGGIMLLKLVNDISSIKATLQSNHALSEVLVVGSEYLTEEELRNVAEYPIQEHIQMAAQINLGSSNPEAAGRAKVIQTQLHSAKRAELAELQGITGSVYSEINPLHLPEVLALVSRHHGQGELYAALKSSIAGVISTVNRKECLKQQKAHHEVIIAEYSAILAEHRTKVQAIESEIAAIEDGKGADVEDIRSESRSNKRRRAT